MRTFVIAMVALGTIAFPAAAQTPKPSVGSDQVYWVATFTVDQIDKFKPIVNKIVAATEKEPGVLMYEYTVGDDQKTVDIHERFTNAHAAVVHVTENFGPNFSKEFLALAKPTRVVVYTAAPTDELKKTLADFNPIYMKPFDGFTRQRVAVLICATTALAGIVIGMNYTNWHGIIALFTGSLSPN